MNTTNTYHIEATAKTPQVEFLISQGMLTIKGRSIPDDASLFYKTVNSWLEEYFALPNESTLLRFQFEYINSSTSKSLQEMFHHLEKKHKKQTVVTIQWFHEIDDQEMEEIGLDFQAIIDLPFEILELENS